MPRRVLVSAAIVAITACGSDGPSALTVDVSGPQGDPLPATNVDDVLSVDVTIAGTRGAMLVDTGSPVVLVDPASFPTAKVTRGAGTIAALDLGRLTFHDQAVVGGDLVTSPDPTLPVAGTLGVTLLGAFAVALDYRDLTVTLGSASLPPHVENPGTSVAFTRKGGGIYELSGIPGSVVFPASRLVVTADLEGTTRTFLVDSGSSYVSLASPLFTSLVADGRTVLDDVATSTTTTARSSSRLARLRSLSVAGAAVSGLVAAADEDVDASLATVSAEVGSPLDGLIGGSFLRAFYVTVDYPKGTLHLRHYTEGGPTYDGFDRVGVGLLPGTGSASPTVATVLAGTDAARAGVSVGDVVVAIDGNALAGLGSVAIDGALSGVVGTHKTVTFGHAALATLSGRAVALTVDDVLPL